MTSIRADNAVPMTVVLGIPFSGLTTEQTLTYFEEAIRERTSRIIITANLDCVVRSMKDPILKRIMYNAALTTPDGMPLVWAGRTMRPPLTERVAGSDFAPMLLERAAKKGHSVFFLGGREGVGERAAERCCKLYPGLRIAGIIAPPFQTVWEMANDDLVERINAAAPDILMIAFGNPKQEYWMSMNLQKLRVPVLIGVGATLDFLSGIVPRAPEWMKRTSTEWIFRLLLEPRRLGKRYAIDIRDGLIPLVLETGVDALMRLLTPRAKAGRQEASSVSTMTVTAHDGTMRVLLVQGCHKHELAALAVTLHQYPCDAVVVDLHHCVHLDSEALSALVAIDRAMRRQAKHCLVVTGRVSRTILRIARLHDVLALYRSLTEALDVLTFFGCHPLRVFDRTIDGTVRIVSFYGELTDWTRSFADGVTFGGPETRTIVDLSEMRFVDAGGIQWLRERWQAERGGAQLHVVTTNSFLATTLRAAGLREQVIVHPTLESALVFFNGRDKHSPPLAIVPEASAHNA